MHKSDYAAYYLAKELIDEFFMTASEFFTNYLERKHMSEALILDLSNANAPVIRRMEGQEAEAFINLADMGKADTAGSQDSRFLLEAYSATTSLPHDVIADAKHLSIARLAQKWIDGPLFNAVFLALKEHELLTQETDPRFPYTVKTFKPVLYRYFTNKLQGEHAFQALVMNMTNPQFPVLFIELDEHTLRNVMRSTDLVLLEKCSKEDADPAKSAGDMKCRYQDWIFGSLHDAFLRALKEHASLQPA